MNNTNQVKNILEFTAIFLSGDLKLTMQSTDYYKEKYNKYIGSPMRHHKETTNTYVEWSKIWGEDDDINSMFLYFLNLVKYHKETRKHWLVNINPSELFNTFEKYLCDIDNVNEERYSHVHHVVKSKIYEKWIKENVRYFKFLRILK